MLNFFKRFRKHKPATEKAAGFNDVFRIDVKAEVGDLIRSVDHVSRRVRN